MIHIRNPNKGPRFLNQVPTLVSRFGVQGFGYEVHHSHLPGAFGPVLQALTKSHQHWVVRVSVLGRYLGLRIISTSQVQYGFLGACEFTFGRIRDRLNRFRGSWLTAWVQGFWGFTSWGRDAWVFSSEIGGLG